MKSIMTFIFIMSISAMYSQGTKDAISRNSELKNIGMPWTGERGVSETTAQIMRHQAEKDSIKSIEPSMIPYTQGENINLPDGQSGSALVKTGFVPDAIERTTGSVPPQSLGLTFKANQSSGLTVPPSGQGAVGSTQFLSADNDRLITFLKATGAADGVLNVTINSFFNSVNSGTSTYYPIVRYDPLSQRFIVTAENSANPNLIFIAVSNSSAITFSTVWTFYSFNISLVPPTGDATCYSDLPTTAVDANALIIGVDNYCPSTYTNSAVFVVRKSSILSGGPIVVTAFRDVGQLSPRGVDSFDADSTGTAPSYFISTTSTTSICVRRITDPAGTPVLSGDLNITVPTMASPLTLEHLGNAHPGGTYNGKIDAKDTRFMPVVKRNGFLWAAHGSSVNSAGTASAGDRDAVRWYQIGNLGTTPTLVQSGTIFDTASTNPKSYTFGTVMVSGQGHAAFGFTVIGADIYNSAGFTGRLANDAAGYTGAPQIFVDGAGPYNAFDRGTSRPQRWGEYSRTFLDPSDDMTIWTLQEFTAQANTSGSSNAQWGIQAAKLNAPPPALPSTASPAAVGILSSVNVTINGISISGSGFFDPGLGFAGRIGATASGGVVVNSVTYVSPIQITLNLNTSAATAGLKDITITNPDGQFATGTNILQIDPALSVCAINSDLPKSFLLDQNYPNPFNPTTKIRFAIAKKGFVSLKMYDLLGKEVVVLVNSEFSPGNYEIPFDGTGLVSGVYFYKLQARQQAGGQAGSFTATKKLLLLK
jgi:hypothetical protein